MEKKNIVIYVFSEELNGKSKEPTTSLIIGANGSGKSFILKILAEIFNAIESTNALGQMKYSHYEVVYIINRELIQLQILNRQIFVHKNGVLLEKYDKSILPTKALQYHLC